MIKENRDIFIKLQKAARESQRREIEVLEREAALNPHVFSDEFNRKMDKLLWFSRKPYFPLVNTVGKRIATVAVMVITVLTITTFSVEALRTPFINFIVSVYEKFSAIVFHTEESEDGSTSTDLPSTLEELYLPERLPEGYTFVETNDFGFLAETIYTDGENDLIFEQYIITSTHITIDTEDVDIERIIIDDKEILFYSNKGLNNIIWTDGLYGYNIMGVIDKTEMLKSINLVNTTK